MEENLLKLLSHHECTLEYIESKLDISLLEIKCLLEKLIKEKQIYIDYNGKYKLISSDQIIGDLRSDSQGKKYIKHNDEKIYIGIEDLHTALKNDKVVVEVFGNNQGVVVGILKRKNNRLVCEVVKKGKKLALTPFNVGCELSVIASKDVLKNLVEGNRVVAILDDVANVNNTVLVNNVEVIGHKNDPKSDELAIAISKDFDTEFSKEAIEQTMNISTEVTSVDKEGRADFTKDNTFTIDSVKTKDMDDAISIKKLYNGNFLLRVHIADVSYYVRPGSPLWKDAEKRATSLYLGDTVIPMIPAKLSNGILSLNEGVDRLTKTVEMEIDCHGRVVNYKIMDSVINSKKKMTYEELNELFDGLPVDSSYAPFIYDIELLRELTRILKKARQNRGNIDFASNDVSVTSNEEEMPVEFSERSNREAEDIIENCMIMANATIASYFYWQELPFIYRVHNVPDDVKLEKTMELIEQISPKLIRLQNAYGPTEIQRVLNKFKGTPEYSAISNILLRSMSKAVYSTENIGHYALALDNYCHFTSPIRRLPDLVIHELLNIFSKDYSLNNLGPIKDRLSGLSHHSSYKERQADDAERDYLKLKMAKYMSQHIGEEFIGIIIDIDRDAVTIKLNNCIKGTIAYTDEFAQAFCIDPHKKELKSRHSKTKAKLGTMVTVSVHNANIPLKEVTFDLVEVHKTNELVRTKD